MFSFIFILMKTDHLESVPQSSRVDMGHRSTPVRGTSSCKAYEIRKVKRLMRSWDRWN